MHRRKIGVGALVATLLVSGTMIGVSIGSPARIEQPQVIEVFLGEILAERSKGLVTQIREEALDADGARVGTIRWNCAFGVDSHCTLVYGLKGSEDERGAVVAFRGGNAQGLGFGDDFLVLQAELLRDIVNTYGHNSSKPTAYLGSVPS